MTGKTRIKAKEKKGVVEVKALAKHPMRSFVEAKLQKKEAHFITYITAKVGDDLVYEASTSQFLSKDPYFKFSFTGHKKGDEIEVTWVDNKGETRTDKAKIK